MREDQIIVGGQAVIEGVMMRAPHSYAVAVRQPNGQIVAKSELLPAMSEKYPMLEAAGASRLGGADPIDDSRDQGVELFSKRGFSRRRRRRPGQ